MKYWISVVSKEHVMRGVKLGIAQIGHGKRSGLARMKTDDWLIYYSPKESYEGKNPLQAFTALSQIVDDDIWQASEGDFKPFRRKVRYLKSQDASIRPLLDTLSFTAGKASWGYSFRYGLFEMTEADFKVIAAAMKVKI
jgi:hypothetical protein